MRAAWEHPEGPNRAAAGMLGVLVGEAWPERRYDHVLHRGPVSTALVELARAYVSGPNDAIPLDVARRHAGAPGPGWLLPVAFARSDIPTLVRDTCELATAAGVPRELVRRCVAYVELAACLLEEWPVALAVRAAGSMIGRPANRSGPGSLPPLAGEPVADALDVSIWALTTPARLSQVLAELPIDVVTGVVPAVAGLLALRDGADQLPAERHPTQPHVVDCHALAPALVHARQVPIAHFLRHRHRPTHRPGGGRSPGACSPAALPLHP